MENQTPDFSLPPQTPVSVPLASPKKPIFPILFAVLVLILLATVGIFAYQNKRLQQQIASLQVQSTPIPSVTPTPTIDPTANWKTYTNTTLGFELKYPQTFIEEGMIYGGPSTGTASPLLAIGDPATMRMGTDKPYDGLNIYHIVSTKQTLLSFAEAEKASATQMENYQGEKPTRLDKVTLAGKPAYKFSSDSAERGIFYYYLELSPGSYLTIAISEESKGSFSELDQVLSTFKFLGDEESNQISNEDLTKGWYWGFLNQKKAGTPDDWTFYEAGRNSCWHKTEVNCQ